MDNKENRQSFLLPPDDDKAPEKDKKGKDITKTLFGKTAIISKMATQEQVNDALLSAVTTHKGKKLGEIMVELGYLTNKQVEIILRRQKTKTMICFSCKKKYQLLDFKKSKTYNCKKCGFKLEDQKEIAKLGAEQLRVKASQTKKIRFMSPDPTSKEKIDTLQNEASFTNYMRAAKFNDKKFPALGYNNIPAAIEELIPDYEKIHSHNKWNNLEEILEWYGCSDISKIKEGDYSSCYLGIKNGIKNLVFIKHSTQAAAIHTFELEMLTSIILEELPNISKTIKIIHTKNLGTLLLQYWIAGDALSDFVDREKRLELDLALYIAQQITDILVQIHSKGIIHFDLKPRNIIIDTTDLKVSIVDFGCSVYIGDKESITYKEMGVAQENIFGTPSYMSCEQITKKAITSLELIIYKCH